MLNLLNRDFAIAVVEADLDYITGLLHDGCADGCDCMVDVNNTAELLGANDFHQVCNTVRSYPCESHRAAWLKYSGIYAESAITRNRVAAYRASVDTATVFASTVDVEPFSPEAIRKMVDDIRAEAYRR